MSQHWIRNIQNSITNWQQNPCKFNPIQASSRELAGWTKEPYNLRNFQQYTDRNNWSFTFKVIAHRRSASCAKYLRLSTSFALHKHEGVRLSTQLSREGLPRTWHIPSCLQRREKGHETCEQKERVGVCIGHCAYLDSSPSGRCCAVSYNIFPNTHHAYSRRSLILAISRLPFPSKFYSVEMYIIIITVAIHFSSR